MPRGGNAPGIQFDGLVLTGERSVEQRQRDEAIRGVRVDAEAYVRVEDYDPVLRAHCGVASPAQDKRR
jgi:hypothetical protein